MWTQGLVWTPAQHGLPHPVDPTQQQPTVLALQKQSYRSAPPLSADIGGIENGNIPTMLGIDMSAAFDCVNRPKLLRLMKRVGIGVEGIKLFTNYFEGRTEVVEIGAKRGKSRSSRVGVLQGSGLSPLFFLLYFIRGVRSMRMCTKCRSETSIPYSEREDRCEICGSSTCYADDLTATNQCYGFNRNRIENKISKQGMKISNMIRKLQLAVNQGKSQFVAFMSSQRRKASRLTAAERENRQKRMRLNVHGASIEETSSIHTLGVTFDERLNFNKHWEE